MENLLWMTSFPRFAFLRCNKPDWEQNQPEPKNLTLLFFPEIKITTHHMVKTAAFFFFNTRFLDLDTNTTPLKQRTRLGTHSAPATTRKRHASPPNFLSAFFRLKKQRQRIKLQHLPNGDDVHPPGLGLLIRQSGKHHLTSCWFISTLEK